MVLLTTDSANNYTSKKKDLPSGSGYSSLYLFEIADNFTVSDRFYLVYSELTIESLYKFWERVAFFLFQFFKPVSNRVTDRNLSLFLLIKELNREYSSNTKLQNVHFDWLKNFILSTNSDFQQLMDYRHPSIHFKYDDSQRIGKDGIISTTLNDWSNSLTNETELER